MRKFEVLKDLSPKCKVGTKLIQGHDGDDMFHDVTVEGCIEGIIEDYEIASYVEDGFLRELKDRYFLTLHHSDVFVSAWHCGPDGVGVEHLCGGNVKTATHTSARVLSDMKASWEECDKARWDQEVAAQKPKYIKCKVEFDSTGYYVKPGDCRVYLRVNTICSAEWSARFVGAVYEKMPNRVSLEWPMWETETGGFYCEASLKDIESGKVTRVWPTELWFTS